jgi:hypothetical protein
MNVMMVGMPRLSKLEPAYNVIRKFDGKGDDAKKRGSIVLAERLNLTRSAVTKWTLPVEQSGTGGYIPHRYYEDILAFAREVGVDLDPAEFVVRSEVAAA